MQSNDIEHEFCRANGYTVVCGCDEAGRGPLCGPVVAAACILPDGEIPEGLNDSKKLTPKKRDRLFDEIRERSLTYCIALSTVEEIDRINILEASLLAMRRAIEGLAPAPDAALIDGNVERDFQLPAKSVIHGDALVPSIAAASILAKVARDRMCEELDRQYPEYGIAKHKGYGTAAHMAALRKFGPSPIHRARFIRFLNPDAPDDDTATDPDAIALARSSAMSVFPPELHELSSPDDNVALPYYILDFKHGGK